ncbi:MAG: YceI family protein [Bacteroidota bacterium]
MIITRKILILLVFLSCCLFTVVEGYGQDYLIDKNGETTFFSEAPIEEIKAISNKSMGILDTASQKVAVSIQMTSFDFHLSLMQEHFNENYVESEKFPKATFSGKLGKPVDYSKQGAQEVPVSGDLTIHGVTKPIETSITFDISEKEILAKTIFEVALEDYDIEIPSIMFNKIAEVVEVTSSFKFAK